MALTHLRLCVFVLALGVLSMPMVVTPVSAFVQGNQFLSFNGSNYLSITHKNNMPSGLVDRSVTVWVSSTATPVNPMGLASWSDTAGTCGDVNLNFYISPSLELCVSTCAHGPWCMPASTARFPNTGQWVFCAFTYTAATKTLTICQDNVCSSPFTGVVLNTAVDVAILGAEENGASMSPIDFFVGNMAEFHVYSIALSTTGLLTDMECNGVAPFPIGIVIRFSFVLDFNNQITDTISLCIAIFIVCPVVTVTPTPTPTPAPFIVGDPVLMGFDGVRHQIHGIPGEVYNLLSMPSLQLNARFTLMTSPPRDSIPTARLRLPSAAQIRNVRLEPSGVVVDVANTQGWTHSGTYMGAIGLLITEGSQEHRLLLEAGTFSHGWHRLIVDGYDYATHGHHHDLGVGVRAGRNTHRAPPALPSFVSYMTSHVLVLNTTDYVLTLVASQHFVNLQQVAVFGVSSRRDDSSAAPLVHGLIGRTYPNARLDKDGGIVSLEDREAPDTTLVDEDLVPETKSSNDDDSDPKKIQWSASAIDQFRLMGRDLFGTEFTYNRYTSRDQ